MSAVLTHNAYGKSGVRLTKVVRRGDWHEIHELDVDVRLDPAPPRRERQPVGSA